MPPKSKPQGESKQGLIITLVFFILATIGLGVSTYFGFADQEKKDKEVADAKKNEKLFKDERDYYKLQAELGRAYMGQAQNIDLAALGTRKGQFDQGTMKIDAYKDSADVKKVFGDLNERFKWDPKENKPKETFETRLAKWEADYDALDKKFKATQKDLVVANEKRQKAVDDYNDADQTYKTKLAEFAKKGGEDLTGVRKQITDLQNKVGKQSDDYKNDLLEKEKLITAAKKESGAKDKEIATLKGRIREQSASIEAYRVRTAEAPPSMRSDWKIVYMDRRGTMPYINLGTRDRVKTKLTFTIHGVGLDGRPNPQPKGTLEVVNVIEDHLSQTRLTSVKDRDRDPIMVGDVLYNASWNPTLKKHVVLAGTMDITGDGRDSLQEFKRYLERQSIVVDGWMDPRDGSLKGKIDTQTDYLVLGESQVFSETGREKAGGGNLDVQLKALKQKAKDNNVTEIPLHKYLELIGYRVLGNINQERPSLYNPTLRDSGPRPADKGPAPMMPNK